MFNCEPSRRAYEMNLRAMLDLPKAERSIYLAALPLTRCYVFGCLDECNIKFIRRVITRNGGVWRELYAPPGLAVTATYRTWNGMMAGTRALVHWQNESIRHVDAGLPENQWSHLLLNDDFGLIPDIPALKFEISNCIHVGPAKVRAPSHPIRG